MSIDHLQAHYGFTRMPFGRGLAPGMLHRHRGHAEAVARIGWCVREHALGVLTGSEDFYLADYRVPSSVAQPYVISQWTTVDLTPLGNATSLEFALTSSDVGQFGMNTPAYFAMDNLTLVPVPEPGTLALTGLGIAGLIGHCRRTSGRRSWAA